MAFIVTTYILFVQAITLFVIVKISLVQCLHSYTISDVGDNVVVFIVGVVGGVV